jgi:hypothetical protein
VVKCALEGAFLEVQGARRRGTALAPIKGSG